MSQHLCHIKKSDNFDGYGFDLHAEKGKPGQYIGKVDDGSPAQAAGLRQGDRIVEVNGASIDGKVHKEVVELIKTVSNETKLLVISEDTSSVTSTDGGSESKQISTSHKNHDYKSHELQEVHGIHKTIENHENQNNNKSTANGTSSNGTNSTRSLSNGLDMTQHAQQIPSKVQNGNGTPMSQGGGGLNLNMTAAELRARLAAKKKFDPKKETTLDFKKKFDMIQKM